MPRANRRSGRAVESEGIAVRCVSRPGGDLFEMQPRSYRDDVLPPEAAVRGRARRRKGGIAWLNPIQESGRLVG